jgi:hypothetical protein
MKYIIPAAILLVLIGAVVIARPDGNSQDDSAANVPSGGSLTAEETSHDFGSISMANGTVSRRFVVKNSSEGSVELEKLYTSCMCTTAELKTKDGTKGPFGMPGHASIPRLKETVLPGEEVEVNIIFDPAAHGPAGVGPIERVVTLEYEGGVLEFDFKAMVTP